MLHADLVIWIWLVALVLAVWWVRWLTKPPRSGGGQGPY